MAAIVFRKIIIYFDCCGLRWLAVDNGYCLFIRCPFPFIAFCVAAAVYRYLFSMRPSIGLNDGFIASYVLLHVRDKAVYFIFICKFHYGAGRRATAVKLYRKLGMMWNERPNPTTTTLKESHRIIVRTKNCRTHFIWIVMGIPMLVRGIVSHVVDWKQHITNGQAFATASKMIACVYDSMGESPK